MKWLRVLLTLIPFVWTIAFLPFANRVKPLVMGLPFWPFGWLLVCLLLFSASVFCIILIKEEKKGGICDDE